MQRRMGRLFVKSASRQHPEQNNMFNRSIDSLIARTLGRSSVAVRLRAVATHALLDGARDPAIVPLLESTSANYECLYDGLLPPRLARVAPYIVDLEQSEKVTSWYRQHGWGNACGILISSSASLATLRRHFRTLAYALTPEGKKVLFRYYDPRVARTFLPTCSEEQLATVFGPIDRFVIEREDGSSGRIYEYRRGEGLQCRHLDLEREIGRESSPRSATQE